MTIKCAELGGEDDGGTIALPVLGWPLSAHRALPDVDLPPGMEQAIDTTTLAGN